MKKKALALAIAGALCVPQTALAATDDSGMQYTSASEGFYGSLRATFNSSNGTKNDGPYIGNDRSSSRLGVRGSLDLGGGLSGVYRTEWQVYGDSSARGQGTRNRLNYVGLKGGFGAVSFGKQWSEDYNFVTSSTDLTNNSTGTFAPYFRLGNLAKYVSPDINGFQGAIQFRMDGASDASVASTATSVGSGGSEAVDQWTLAAKYGIRGFTVAGVYDVKPEGRRFFNAYTVTNPAGAGNATAAPRVANGIGTEDATFWAVRLGYGQDNWSVNAWYGEHNTSDDKSAPDTDDADAVRRSVIELETGATGDAIEWTRQDAEILSVAGNVSVGKVNIYAILDAQEDEWKRKDNRVVVGVTYKLGSRSRVWVDYQSNDFDSNPKAEDTVAIGLRHDF